MSVEVKYARKPRQASFGLYYTDFSEGAVSQGVKPVSSLLCSIFELENCCCPTTVPVYMLTIGVY